MIYLAIIFPFITAVFIPILYRFIKQVHTGWFLLPVPIVLFSYFLKFIGTTRVGMVITKTIDWIPSFNINFSVRVDGLSLLFALLITGIGSLVVFYSIFYLSKEHEKLNTFYVYLSLFMGAMLGVVLSDNLIVLYVFWELTSISSFLLIGYWHHREKSQYGAQKSLLITVFGGLSMLSGILMVEIITGTFTISEMISNSGNAYQHELFIPAMLCFLLGAFTKSAQFPFYIWLPDAMEAPTPVSAYLHSATMVKAGIFLVARMMPVFGQHSLWFWLVGVVGIVTLFWGSFSAVKQTDLKSILAFSTVSQLGMIITLLGVGSAALQAPKQVTGYFLVAATAAVFHLVNHATFKGCLFMVAGIIDHETGTRDIRKLGGLISIMPISFSLMAIGTLSMAGIPPFNGFLSKEMFFTGMLRVKDMAFFNLGTWGLLFPVFAWAASVFTFIYSMVLLFKPFTGEIQTDQLQKQPHEAPLGLLVPPVVLASLVVVIGIFPNILSETIISPALSAIFPSMLSEFQSFKVHISFWHGFTTELFMSLGVVGLGTLLYMTFPKWGRIYRIFPDKLTLNKIYDNILVNSQVMALKLIKLLMNGYIRTYLVYIFSFLIVVLNYSLITKNAFIVKTNDLAPIRIYELMITLMIVVATVTILFAKSRLSSVILLGAVGYSVALFFVVFRAPDLALTQLVIETVSVALFLVCFYHLPKQWNEERIRFKLTNLLISIGVGFVVMFIAFSSHSNKLFDSIAHYYIENTYEKAAGKNMVNVILVDFRGFDTLFEICVLAIAALGIYTMIKLRMNRREHG